MGRDLTELVANDAMGVYGAMVDMETGKIDREKRIDSVARELHGPLFDRLGALDDIAAVREHAELWDDDSLEWTVRRSIATAMVNQYDYDETMWGEIHADIIKAMMSKSRRRRWPEPRIRPAATRSTDT